MHLNLHTSHNNSDWSTIDKNDWNIWQKIAAKTMGVVTPGNLVSCGGAVLVLIGFFKLTDDVTLAGVLLVAVGRLADAIDGFVAHRTGTKSFVGEAIDSIMDKLVASVAIIIIIAFSLLPTIMTVLIAAHTIINSLIAIVGRLRKIRMHPSLAGKIATFMIWATILSHLLYQFVKAEDGNLVLESTTLVLSWVFFIIFAVLGLKSTLSYTFQVKSKKKEAR